MVGFKAFRINKDKRGFMRHLFCFGLSYTAEALIRRIGQSGEPWRVTAAVRAASDIESKSKVFVPANVEMNLVRFGGEDSIASLKNATHILSSVPPTDDGDPVLSAYRDALTSIHPEWLAYLSTTGPYGDCDGAWVDENTPTNPSGRRGRRRVAAEEDWRKLAEANNLALHIFRLPGLYGPGRSMLDRLRNGTARRIIKPDQVFSRIHIDDLANVLFASMNQPATPSSSGAILYNIADDEPAPPQDVVTYAAELLRIEPPAEIPFDDADLTPMARSFYSDNKRISNQKMKKELSIELL
jgi:nucleoside-diphosphate-sugar epimerase